MPDARPDLLKEMLWAVTPHPDGTKTLTIYGNNMAGPSVASIVLSPELAASLAWSINPNGLKPSRPRESGPVMVLDDC